MVLKEAEIKQVIGFVKKEPRTVQDIAKLLKKSWLTADSYVLQIREKTGLIDVKTFRAGTQGALKLVYYANPDSISSDEVKENLFAKIKAGKSKHDFDFMELYQFVNDKNKKSFSEQYVDEEDITDNYKEIIKLYKRAQHNIYSFSGNLSFLNLKGMIETLEELLKRKVTIRLICRINPAALNNFQKLVPLLQKYPGLIEVRHAYHPLRGFIIDGNFAHFKNEMRTDNYKKGELAKNIRIYYEFYDEEWILWLEKVFWNTFRSSIDGQQRVKELKKIF